MKTSIVHFALLLTGALALTACGHDFDIKTPSGFVELKNRHGRYDYRATTADGLVIAVREIDNEVEGELVFWSTAIQNQMRQRVGYALLADEDVTSADGVAGKHMHFGHDEDGRKPHLYDIIVFVTEAHVVLLEIGGAKPIVTAGKKQIEQAVASFSVRGR
jgi:hypothetical protein